MSKVYYDEDANLEVLQGKTIAIIGFGSQGSAQAQNLRDSGLEVIVSDLPGTPGFEKARNAGFSPLSAAEAAQKGDVIQILAPDQYQAGIYKESIAPHLKAGGVLM
ncbi:MAG: NAD(P)-dependent oxidoreductase, partial [Atribacterota bacterium]|nr:NAD(P)-dependent oxidoreductase [Atribacterota bacterium]